MYEDTRFFKYGKLEAMSSPREVGFSLDNFQVFEKIDGGNCQVRKIGNRLIAGSKANYLTGRALRNRIWFQKLNKWVFSNPSLQNLPEGFILFGEWAGNHTIEYPKGVQDTFFMLDLFDVQEQKFLDYNFARSLLSDSGIGGITYLRLLNEGSFLTRQDLARFIEETSDYYSGPREGIVSKNYLTQRRFKLLHPDFSEKVRLPNGNLDCLTPARYRKVLFNLVDSGFQRVSRSVLVEKVIEDIETEERFSPDKSEASDRYLRFLKEGKFFRLKHYLEN